jgi:vacuolar-type H+-ATPase subunit H
MSKFSIEKEIRQAEREIEKAVDEGVTGENGILQEAIDRGQETISDAERVWHKQVLNGFMTKVKSENPKVYQIFNRAKYADVVNEGAEYDSPPPADALLPWVRDHLYLFDAEKYPTARDAAWAVSWDLYENGQEGILFTAVMLEYLNIEAEADLERYLNRRLSARL